MEVQLIQIGTPAFNELVKAYVDAGVKAGIATAIKLMKSKPETEWVGADRALKILGCGKSKLQELRDSKAIVFTEDRRPRYKVSSLKEYLENKAKH